MGTIRNAGRWSAGLAMTALACVGTPPTSGTVDDTAGRLGTNVIVFSSLRAEDAGTSDDIYIKDVDGAGERRLTTAPGQDGAAMVSPDRRTIAFASERTGLMQLWAMDVDGSDQRQLLDSGSFDFHPAWSHDGASILFQRRSPTTGLDLWVLDADTGGQRQLTGLPRNEIGAFFSPDDSLVAFGGNNGTSQDVWVVPASGGTPIALTSDVCIAGTDPCVRSFDGHPSWTPDGRILFLSDRSGGIGIWTMSSEGSDPRLVVDLGEASAGMPAMSANGQRITFVTDLHALGGDRNVYTVRHDGRQLRRLTSTGDDLAPQFASGG